MLDYRTQWSGVTEQALTLTLTLTLTLILTLPEQDLEGVNTTLADLQNVLLKVRGGGIFLTPLTNQG